MKVKLFTNSGVFDRSIVLEGFTMTGYLMLARNPMTAGEAATKRYVDNFPYNLSVDNLTGSTVPMTLLGPGIDGDISMLNGTQSVLKSVVASGSYSRYTVNAKGQIIAGVAPSADNALPTLAFSEIKSRPIGVDGYTTTSGNYIRNTPGLANGAFTAPLILSRTPTTDVEVASYGYLFNLVTTRGSNQDIGSYAIKPNTKTYDKYLRANGAWVNRTTYAALFNMIGLDYSSSGGSEVGYAGQPWAQQGAFNDTVNSTGLGWASGGSYPITIAHPTVFVTKNRVYSFGGYSGPTTDATTATIRTAYTAVINTNGTLGAWAATTSFPINFACGAAIVTKGYVYIFGGQSTMAFYPDTNGETVLNSAYMAKINEDGTIGTWTKTTNLPFANSRGFFVVVKNFVYMLGGYNGTAERSNVQRAPINSDGTIGSWSSSSSLPAVVSTETGTISVTKTYVHVCRATVRYSAVINADGTLGAWSTYNSGVMGPGLSGYAYAAVVSTQKRTYAIGGSDIVSTWIGAVNGGSVSYSASIKDVYSAAINLDGTMGTWTSAETMPMAMGGQGVFVTSSRLYTIGGISGQGDVNNPSKNFTVRNNIYYSSFGGGTNDYMALIIESGIDPNLFKLPDLTSKTDGIYEYYIKALP